MPWTEPELLLPGFALVLALLAIVSAGAGLGRLRRRQPVSASFRLLLALALGGLGLGLGGIGLSLSSYGHLTAERPVAVVEIRALEDQLWTVVLAMPDGRTGQFELAGDAWQLDARVLKWSGPAAAIGFEPLYRLERLSGRYDDIGQEREALRSAYALGESGALDLWDLKRGHAQWLPFVDAEYGSGVYLPMRDGARYEVTLGNSGLIARELAVAGTN